MAVLESETESLDSLMSRADAAVYQAKQNGRGQLVDAAALTHETEQP